MHSVLLISQAFQNPTAPHASQVRPKRVPSVPSASKLVEVTAPSASISAAYLVMSVVASQSEPPTILAANTAQHIAKPNILSSDLVIRVTPCSMVPRISDRDPEVYHSRVEGVQRERGSTSTKAVRLILDL